MFNVIYVDFGNRSIFYAILFLFFISLPFDIPYLLSDGKM